MKIQIILDTDSEQSTDSLLNSIINELAAEYKSVAKVGDGRIDAFEFGVITKSSKIDGIHKAIGSVRITGKYDN